MKFFPDPQTVLSIGSLEVKWYAVIILTGAFLGYYLSLREARKKGIKDEHMEDLFFGVLLFGILGARIWFVLFSGDLGYYFGNPLKIFATWEGGLAIQGGLIAGALYGWHYTKKHNLSFIEIADATLPNVLIAQAIGRWGNFINQEAYGQIISEKFYDGWPQFFKDQMFIDGAYRQPTFFLESVLNIIGWFFIKFIFTKLYTPRRGDKTYAYLIWYGAVRYVVEGFRSDSLMFRGFKSARIVSLIFIAIGMLGILGLFRKKRDGDVVVMFDFDGTLADSNPIIIESFTRVIKKHAPELEITREMELSFIGPTLEYTFSKYLGDDSKLIRQCVKEYREINFELQKTKMQEIEHATKLLKQLKNDGVHTAIISSKKKDSLVLGVEILGFDPYIDFIIGSDEVKKAKPNPEGINLAMLEINCQARNFYYVGDTKTDVQAAHKAGVIPVAIITEPNNEKSIRSAKPNYIIYDLMELTQIIEVNLNGEKHN